MVQCLLKINAFPSRERPDLAVNVVGKVPQVLLVSVVLTESQVPPVHPAAPESLVLLASLEALVPRETKAYRVTRAHKVFRVPEVRNCYTYKCGALIKMITDDNSLQVRTIQFNVNFFLQARPANPVSLVRLDPRDLQAKTDSTVTRALLELRVTQVPQVSQVLEGLQVCLVALVSMVLREKEV